MRRALVLSALAITACSSKPQPDVAPLPQQTIRIPGSSGGVPTTMGITHTTTPSVRTVGASVDAVWNALPAVYTALGIPIEDRNVAARTLGNPALKLRRRLGDVALSKYLDCGNTQGGPSADTYEIVLSVDTRVRAAAGGADSAVVTTIVDGRGRPVAFSADYVNCGSRGQLEKRFFDLLSVELRR
jgi:hypothetical protein